MMSWRKQRPISKDGSNGIARSLLKSRREPSPNRVIPGGPKVRSLISRIAISLIAFCVGLGLASLCHVLFVHRVTRLELIANQTKQVCAPKTRNEADNDVSVTGRYTNFNYAYSVLVPRGMMGATSPAP